MAGGWWWHYERRAWRRWKWLDEDEATIYDDEDKEEDEAVNSDTNVYDSSWSLLGIWEGKRWRRRTRTERKAVRKKRRMHLMPKVSAVNKDDHGDGVDDSLKRDDAEDNVEDKVETELLNEIAQKSEPTRRHEDDKAKRRRKRKETRRQASEALPEVVCVLENTWDDVEGKTGDEVEGMIKKSEEVEGAPTCPSHLVVEGGIAAVSSEEVEGVATLRPSRLMIDDGIAAESKERKTWPRQVSSIGRAMGRGRGFNYEAEYEKSRRENEKLEEILNTMDKVPIFDISGVRWR
eukprot:TRINITY_DN24533_c0_g2_i6.p1 TRINITY_DN24533_c0_g2~~TRINITY_DN24533_c0_g2_i6.p1  ORF type:complete len:291 (+),score=74.46 TRINITY_DN24533_c0_g2_i6:117-989(+)